MRIGEVFAHASVITCIIMCNNTEFEAILWHKDASNIARVSVK